MSQNLLSGSPLSRSVNMRKFKSAQLAYTPGFFKHPLRQEGVRKADLVFQKI